jgi:hypothetical protein
MSIFSGRRKSSRGCLVVAIERRKHGGGDKINERGRGRYAATALHILTLTDATPCGVTLCGSDKACSLLVSAEGVVGQGMQRWCTLSGQVR